MGIMSELIGPELVHIRIEVPNRDTLFTVMANRLQEEGRVESTFLQGLIDREVHYPTGLPVNGGVAIPHTDPEHVLKDSISIATLATPVGFREMAGIDDTEIPVDVVFVLALGGSGQHLTMLQRVIKCIQDLEFMDVIRHSESAVEVAEITLAKLTSDSV